MGRLQSLTGTDQSTNHVNMKTKQSERENHLKHTTVRSATGRTHRWILRRMDEILSREDLDSFKGSPSNI